MEKIKEFLNSNLNEAEYFLCQDENYITLRDYLEKLSELEWQFKHNCSDSIKSIQDKCLWVEDVIFSGLQSTIKNEFLFSNVRLQAFDNDELVVSYDSKFDSYIEMVKDIPRIYCLKRSIRTHLERQSDIAKIQSELHEIDLIGRDVFYGYLEKLSISEKFLINYLPFLSVSVFEKSKVLDEECLCRFYRTKRIRKFDQQILDYEEQGKMLSRILIPKHKK